MGKAANITREQKDAIKTAARSLGMTDKLIRGKNIDGMETPHEVLYRAAAVLLNGGSIVNAGRGLPGGVTVAAVLEAVGFDVKIMPGERLRPSRG